MELSCISMLSISNHFFTYKSRNSNGRGDVGIYIHNNYEFKEWIDFTIFADRIFESVFAEI